MQIVWPLIYQNLPKHKKKNVKYRKNSHRQILDFGNKRARDIQKTQNISSPDFKYLIYVFISFNTAKVFHDAVYWFENTSFKY